VRETGTEKTFPAFTKQQYKGFLSQRLWASYYV